MPLGYQNPWPEPQTLSIATDKKLYEQWLAERKEATGYDQDTGDYKPDFIERYPLEKRFAFWMPSLRPVERNRKYSVARRPCEAGRAQPTSDEYVVEFSILWAFGEDPSKPGSIRSFHVAERQLKETGFLRSQAKYLRSDGTVGQRPSVLEHSLDGPITGFKRFNSYGTDGDVVAILNGSKFLGPKVSINPSCGGRAWNKTTNTILYLILPADQCVVGHEARWKEPVRAAFQLLNSWRVTAKGN